MKQENDKKSPVNICKYKVCGDLCCGDLWPFVAPQAHNVFFVSGKLRFFSWAKGSFSGGHHWITTRLFALLFLLNKPKIR